MVCCWRLWPSRTRGGSGSAGADTNLTALPRRIVFVCKKFETLGVPDARDLVCKGRHSWCSRIFLSMAISIVPTLLSLFSPAYMGSPRMLLHLSGKDLLFSCLGVSAAYFTRHSRIYSRVSIMGRPRRTQYMRASQTQRDYGGHIQAYIKGSIAGASPKTLIDIPG